MGYHFQKMAKESALKVCPLAIVIFIYVNLVHLLALLKKDNGLMDAAWGTGFILVALFKLGLADGLDARRVLIDFLLLRVSGIPVLEAKYKDRPEYRE